MARRSRKSLFGATFQRSFNALTRATLRSGTRAVVDAMKKNTRRVAKAVAAPAPRKRALPAAGGTWTSGVALSAGGARRYRLFKPAGARQGKPLPLLVMLHGCGQDATSFALGTRMQTLAAREGVVLLFPEQERLANAQGCWNWFEIRSGRAFNEAASILGAIDQACLVHGADPKRVAAVGFSAGAGMAALLGVRYPERFAAIAMHSGVAPGTAHSTATAIAAMQGRRRPDALATNLDLPPLLVIQGSADHIVAVANGRAAAASWAVAGGAVATASREVQRGKRRPMVMTDFKRRGRTLASLCEVQGLAHAWSGGAASQPYSDPTGPDASRMAWAFASRCFEAPTPRKALSVAG